MDFDNDQRLLQIELKPRVHRREWLQIDEDSKRKRSRYLLL